MEKHPKYQFIITEKKPDGLPNGGYVTCGTEKCYVSKTFQLIGAIDAKVISILFSAFPKEILPILENKFKIKQDSRLC